MFKNELALINKNWDKREMTAEFWLLKADELLISQSKESWNLHFNQKREEKLYQEIGEKI